MKKTMVADSLCIDFHSATFQIRNNELKTHV